MKTELPSRADDKTRTIVTLCPCCHSDDLRRDYKREESYCNNCGVVLTSAVQYVGLTKVKNIVPYSAPYDARNGIHMKWFRKEDLGKTDYFGSMRKGYRHNFTDKELMRKGRGRRKR